MTRTSAGWCIALALVAVTSSGTIAQRGAAGPDSAPAQAARRTVGPVTSPEIAADGRVTFRLRAPDAKEVSIALSGAPAIPMQKDEDGVWSVTTSPLSPDIYTYSLRVDGARITDPSNRDYETSFTSFQNMFFVPGPEPWLPAPGLPRGAVARHTFLSAVAGDDREFFVYTPAGYDAKRAQAYPVFFLLHGLGDDAGRWVNAGAANVILDNLIAAKKAVPMVLVSTLGYGTSRGPAGARGQTAVENITGYTRILIDEVMPRVERAYNVSKDRNRRAIAGLSMGGMETVYTALNHLDRFAWIASFSGAFTMWPGVSTRATAPASQAGAPPQRPAPVIHPEVFDSIFPGFDAKANSKIRMLWIVCGTSDGLIGVNREFKAWLTAKGVRFTEQEVPDMGHVWPLWRRNVADLVPRLFR